MSAIDSAVARLQDLSQALTGITIKSAPDYPIESAAAAPFSLAYLDSGEFWGRPDVAHIQAVVNVDFLFSRTNMKQMYQQADTVAIEYSQRLVKDPTLNSTVDSIRIDLDLHPTFTTQVVQWDQVTLFLLRFQITLKILESPLS